jgi:hypothetical protein
MLEKVMDLADNSAIAPFLVKLWQILADQNYHHVVAWGERYNVREPVVLVM